MRLQNKILLLLIPLIMLPILALGWTAYALLMEDARDRTQDQVTTLLEQIRLQNNAQLQTARANASSTAGAVGSRRTSSTRGRFPARARWWRLSPAIIRRLTASWA